MEKTCCFLHALAYQIESNEIGGDYLRAILTAEMLKNIAIYRPFIVSS
jgi:hypothetical protein